MSLEFETFSNDDLDSLNEALVRRSSELQQLAPGLPSARGFNLAEKLRDGVGVVAHDGATIVGCLVGQVDGRTAKVPLSGCLAETDAMLETLYCEAAPSFVDRGAVIHEIYAPHTALYRSGFASLGFGHGATQLVIETRAFTVATPYAGIVVRPARGDDEDARVEIEREFIDHLNAPPSFSNLGLDTDEEIREELRASLTRYDFEVFVAEVDGEVLGELVLYARPLDGERIPEASVDLAFCAVRAGDRGRGIGTALTAHAVERIRERGCRFVTIDVRTTNRRASTFWGHFPFAPVVARFERHLAEPR